MTISKAIEILKNPKDDVPERELECAYKEGAAALRRLSAKKPRIDKSQSTGEVKYNCEQCNYRLDKKHDRYYCPNCGQRIIW